MIWTPADDERLAFYSDCGKYSVFTYRGSGVWTAWRKYPLPGFPLQRFHAGDPFAAAKARCEQDAGLR